MDSQNTTSNNSQGSVDTVADPDLVTLTIDEREVTVKKGTNLIEAAKRIRVDIPHYCYHSHLSVAGNCRMCQVKVEGAPKLTIACNTGAVAGMKVQTGETSEEVRDAQRATLEFLLLNHPLDCTVCDQAGHCKLQDYYYEYNAKGSRFSEDKVHKVKAEPLGPEVIYDGERCIVCTRCVRFCEEVTKTGELGVFNRGDKSVIGIYEGVELNNPLSGSVVDLCPVGALTHRRWRFNTRIWYTEQHDSICAGCSTGCNVKVAVRDGEIVHVKARANAEVNKEWLCDEGRYGFDRFQAGKRLTVPCAYSVDDEACFHDGDDHNRSEHNRSEHGGSDRRATGKAAAWHEVSAPDAMQKVLRLRTEGQVACFISPFLTLEEMWVTLDFLKAFSDLNADNENVAMSYRARQLSREQAVLVSPDYAPNAFASTIFGIVSGGDRWREELELKYEALLRKIDTGVVEHLLFVGDFAMLKSDFCERQGVLDRASTVVSLTSRAASLGSAKFPMVKFPMFDLNDTGSDTDSSDSGCDGRCHGSSHCASSNDVEGVHDNHGENCADGSSYKYNGQKLLLPVRSVNEKSGLYCNRDGRIQRLKALLTPPVGSMPEWQWLQMAARAGGLRLACDTGHDTGNYSGHDQRELFHSMVKNVPKLAALSLYEIGDAGKVL